MLMPSPTSPTVSLRLPDAIKKELDKIASSTRRSRSSLMLEALEVYLEDRHRRPHKKASAKRYASLLKYQSAAAKSGGRSAAEIDAILQDIRGDD